jgi:hypothetical protein
VDCFQVPVVFEPEERRAGKQEIKQGEFFSSHHSKMEDGTTRREKQISKGENGCP